MILTRAVGSRDIVSQCCAACRTCGVVPAMDMAHARSLLPAGREVWIERHRPDRDERALVALASWALRFAPTVAPDPPDGLLIDISGTERLHRHESQLIRRVAAGTAKLGFSARIASASTFGTAWAIARFGRYALARVPTGQEKQALAGLPLQCLRISDETVRGLVEIGITRVEQLLALPRASVAARFEPLLLQRLTQALGELDERIEPIRPTPALRREVIFDGPTDHWESVEAAARTALEALTADLARFERGLRRLVIELLTPQAGAEPRSLEIDLSRPTRTLRHLWVLVRTRLEREDLGEGIEGIIMSATRTSRLRHEQHHIDEHRRDASPPNAWGELIDTLTSRLGPDRVVRIEPVASHLPERAFVERSMMEASRREQAEVCAASRPTLLYARPEGADVLALTPDGPVARLTWRGTQHLATTCLGPERIGQEWWRWMPDAHGQRPPDRDYFAVRLESGRWLWMFRHIGTGRWFIHGEWA